MELCQSWRPLLIIVAPMPLLQLMFKNSLIIWIIFIYWAYPWNHGICAVTDKIIIYIFLTRFYTHGINTKNVFFNAYLKHLCIFNLYAYDEVYWKLHLYNTLLDLNWTKKIMRHYPPTHPNHAYCVPKQHHKNI